MTKVEKASKIWLERKLSEEGHPRYAELLSDFDLHLTSDPSVVGYMNPKTGAITVNKGLDEDQICVVIRHEILHWFLKHEKRLIKHLGNQMGFDSDELLNQNVNEIKKALYSNGIFNIAADYEISNRGYTEADKKTVRAIKLNGQLLRCLVTEDDHEDWTELSVEEMFDKLREEQAKNQESGEIVGHYIDPTTFIDPMTGVTYGI